jgi:dolichol-phosphate mannosyltransferase
MFRAPRRPGRRSVGTRGIRHPTAPYFETTPKIAYRVIAWFSDVPIPTDSGDFRLITRQVRDALESCTEYNR